MISDSRLDTIANVMEVQVSDIHDESTPATIENWDSFRGLVLFEELETKFGVKFTLNELLNIKKIRDIKNILSARGLPMD